MIIKDLIAKLQTLDGDTMVVTASYEGGGFGDLTEILQVDLVLNGDGLLDGSTHHRAEWSDEQRRRSIAAICLGPRDPSYFGGMSKEFGPHQGDIVDIKRRPHNQRSKGGETR